MCRWKRKSPLNCGSLIDVGLCLLSLSALVLVFCAFVRVISTVRCTASQHGMLSIEAFGEGTLFCLTEAVPLSDFLVFRRCV